MATQLTSRQDEAIETLKAEGVFIESWFHVVLHGRDYLIAYMRAQDIQKAQEIGRKSQFDIDQVHRAFKQHWIQVHPASLLIDLNQSS